MRTPTPPTTTAVTTTPTAGGGGLERARSPAIDFAIAASATSSACVLSNPMEVVKTRMQLQSELVLKEKAGHGSSGGASFSQPSQRIYQAPYRNAAHAFYKICRDEGLRGIQAGLLPGIMYQVTMNGTRLSLFQPVQKVLGVDEDKNSKMSFFVRNLAAGAACGVIGALIGSPLFLVKARLQSQSTAHNLRTDGGGEFRYRGMWHALKDILETEGPRGLTRGMSASVMRVAVGSATQLSVYASCKRAVLRTGFVDDNVYAYLASSMVAGLVVSTAMNPLDVISTRLSAQGTGVKERYKGPIDCAAKTIQAEGVRGLYKGWTPLYLRLGPHTIYTFLFWEEFKKLANRWGL